MTTQEFIESVSQEGEVWKDVVNWEGYYMVSNYGRVLSVERDFVRKNGNAFHVDFRLLKPNVTNHNGIMYNYICLRKNSKRYVMGIHRLVAEVFLPNPNNYSDVDHIDRNGLNNHVENLRWTTRSMNMLNENTRRINSISQRRKRLPTLHKPIVQIKDNAVVKVYNTVGEIEQTPGITTKIVLDVCKGRRESYKDSNWMYLSDYQRTQTA